MLLDDREVIAMPEADSARCIRCGRKLSDPVPEEELCGQGCGSEPENGYCGRCKCR